MTVRRLAGLLLFALLLVGAGGAAWRSAHAPRGDPVTQVAAQLRCPACDGESVAQSRSPVAAAMRATIAQQVAAGRSPAQIRSWFVQRYGTEVLAEPPARGVGALLWVIPAVAAVAAALLAVRAVRRRAPPAARAARAARPRPAAPGGRRVWDLVAVGMLAMVAAVALTARSTGATAPPVATTAPRDPVQAELTAAQSLEQQGQYAAAADVYRQVVRQRPDDQVRLRLAFALMRAGRPAEAADNARQVLAGRPDDPEALLLLGLAQRATNSPDAPATLRHFLAVAPDNPAAPEVRRLLGQP